ncbi:hypothetical protein ACFDR9_004364 [Janthinobacterium sp. CG_23.3]|uniref:hypothetical protein n=1 Tax=unclassified Janthinobacterium TaxID=2610881 RepID=UPI00036A6691|nr:MULTISPECIES: hypothetical protein [unclassified Janthinobacterium]MEC5161962.1 hypothetical protein [Janthinobacterium sp. CG_S6]
MTHKLSALPLARHAMLGLLLAHACALAGATEFAGRGVFAFPSASGCPLAALTGNAEQCNRLALDHAETRATLDQAEQLIHFHNTRQYAKKTVVGDVLLQGSGLSEDGKRVPLGFHLVLSKSGDKWSTSQHTHAPVKGNFSAVQIDPYQVDVTEADGKRVVLVAEKITETLTQPSLATRLASDLVQVRDNRAKDARDADITIAVGAGKLSKSVMRARLHSDPVNGGNVDSLLTQGSWAFELEALTGKIPDAVAQRELFLFGLSGQPMLKPLLVRGFKKHEKLSVGAVNGKGYLRFGDQQQDFPGADAVARAFLQQSFIGLVLGWQQLDGGAHAR